MRVPLLLVPRLVTDTDSNEKYTPQGACSGKLPVTYFDGSDAKFELFILLLDSRLYAQDLASQCATYSEALPDGVPLLEARGIVNFGIDSSDQILLPREVCFALKLFWDGLPQGNLSPSGNVKMLSGAPSTFILESKVGLKIPKAELAEHGIQFVSLYL